jgi:hypothetical protein
MEVIITMFILPNLLLLVGGLLFTLICLSKDFNLDWLQRTKRGSGVQVGPQYWGSYGGLNAPAARGLDSIKLPKILPAPEHDPGDVIWDEGAKKTKKN